MTRDGWLTLGLGLYATVLLVVVPIWMWRDERGSR